MGATLTLPAHAAQTHHRHDAHCLEQCCTLLDSRDQATPEIQRLATEIVGLPMLAKRQDPPRRFRLVCAALWVLSDHDAPDTETGRLLVLSGGRVWSIGVQPRDKNTQRSEHAWQTLWVLLLDCTYGHGTAAAALEAAKTDAA